MIISVFLVTLPWGAQLIARMPNTVVRRSLATFQCAQVANLTIYFGKTFPTPLPKAGSAPRLAPSVVIRDPATIRRWKVAMAASMYDVVYGKAALGSGPRWDSVRFDLKDGRQISYLLYGPYDVADHWGPEVYKLYREAVDEAKWGASRHPRP